MLKREPDLTIGNFKLWILGRQFPDAQEFWDANWLIVYARYTNTFSKVAIEGPYIHLSELAQWKIDCENLYATLSGKAELDCMEPNINVCITLNQRGQGELRVNITPDNVYEQHFFCENIDQSYLKSVITNLSKILTNYQYPYKL